ncbi:response regulator transcription factor [Terriglobus roseus]|uniref:Two component transcriptional regulator, LuxR family n=1 Tax=Terriglobus roseus TaxID=392734 RepID=A0A1G7GZN8_9BACT|nr:response regulator transcription factor [Terriglobus roseus]SDE93597.1 two component transcriptional regulator, LuxR family [Terriglobus roseus]
MIRVLAVDDHPLLRAGVIASINAQADMTVVGEAATGEEAIQQFRNHRPDVTVMDLRLPGKSGIEAITEIRAEFPRARMIVLTTYAGDVQALRAFQAGASGYLLKNMLRTELIDTIRSVHAGMKRVPADIAAMMAEHAGEDILSDREVEILRHVSAGKANKMIAYDLNLSEHTVKGHLKNILGKLNANDRTHAVTIAMSRGFFH